MSKSSKKSSSHISYEDENDELIDEINSFHAKDRAIDKSQIYRGKKFDHPQEFLSVEADASDSSDDDGSDFDDDDEDVNDITDNQWGKKRKDFYGTSFVDEDWGGMREEEEQDAELEEEDALNRQKQLDKSTALIADIFDDDDDEEEKEEKDQNGKAVEIETVLEFNEKNAKRKNKKIVKLLQQFEARKRIFELVVKPLENIIQILPKCSLRSQLVYIAQTYASYLMNTAYLLKLKAKQLSEKKLEDPMIEIHPIQEALIKLNKRIVECEDYLHNNSDQLDEMKSWAQNSPEKMKELIIKVGEIQLSRKKNEINITNGNGTIEKENEEINEKEDEKRKAIDRIAKNKAYHDKRGKKKAKISKTKNRRKVRAIEKRVKSQIGNVRREINKYSGEASGIRASTIKSTKLIA